MRTEMRRTVVPPLRSHSFEETKNDKMNNAETGVAIAFAVHLFSLRQMCWALTFG